MKELGDVSSRQTAGIKETPCCSQHPALRDTESSVNKSVQDCFLSPVRKHTAEGKVKTHHQHKSFVEESGCLDISDCNFVSELSRSSSDSGSSSGIPTLSVESDTPCNLERNIPILENELDFSFKRNQKQQENYIWNTYGVKAKPEYERCINAVVRLHDFFKVRKELKNRESISISVIKNLVKMKPGGSRSPKRHSPVRGNVTAQNAKDSVVRTTYVKPSSKESMLEGKAVADGKSNSYTFLDGLSEKVSPGTDSPKQKKKSVKGETIIKNDSPSFEQRRTQKKRIPTVHGDTVMLATDQEKTSKKKIDTGQDDSDLHEDRLHNMNKDAVEMENTGTPKKRGRKPKSADSSPVKEKQKKSPGSNAKIETNTVVPDISLTPPKDSKKILKSPKTKKKREECETRLENTKQNDETVEKETLSVKSKSRGTSESPVRRKRSPKKVQEENESPKSKKVESTQKSKKSKILNENDDNNAVELQSGRSSVDEVIDAVVNENIAMLNKSSASKSPSRKNKRENSDKKSTPPSKDKKQTPKEKKTVKNNSQEKEACSLEKKKPRSRSNSASPKKDKKKIDQKLDTNAGDASPKRKLDFDDDITKLILERSKLPFPSDFQYKYTSSGIKSGLLGLDDLISKVNSSVKDRDDNLTAIFGKSEEQDFYSDDKSPSPMDSDFNVSTDSDKTISEFVDLPDNSNKVTEVVGLKDNIIGLRESATEGELSKDGDLLENGRNGNPDDFGGAEASPETPKQSENEKEVFNIQTVSKPESDEGKGRQTDMIKGNCSSSEVVNESDVQSNNAQLDPETKDEISIENNDQSVVNENEQNSGETVSIFEMFGLTLKKPNAKEVVTPDYDDSSAEQSNFGKENTEKKLDNSSEDKQEKAEEEDDDVMFVSETKPDDSIVILSDDDEIESNCVDRSGYESLKESANGRVKPKCTTVNTIVEPKPLHVLHLLERAESKKENAFACSELDEYLHLNKENMGPTDVSQGKQMKSNIKEGTLDVKEELKKAEPDFDEIDGHVFVSFASEHALKAHISLENKIDWLTEVQLKKMTHLKQLKERQHDTGSRRITSVKSGEEQKQNFRGIPMRLMKYQKMLKQELEDILLGRQSRSPEKSPSKTPTKTTDITKIKGWKSKFQNAEELQEATGLNISESGKLHWKTEERLVKNLDPEDIKDIGLDLKKKRRKLVNYTGKKKSVHGSKVEEKDSEMMEYEYEIDELAIIESDVYNEDEDKPPPEKIPYNVKYSSQHKYGVRKLFVKKMRLDAEDERILQKLGTQKHIGQKPEVPNSPTKRKKGKQIFALSKLTHTMAVAAVSAFDRTLLNRAIGLEKAEVSRKKKMEARVARREGKSRKTVVHNDTREVKAEDDVEDHYDDETEKPDDAEIEDGKDAVAEENEMELDEEEDSEPEGSFMRTRSHSSASRSSHDLRKSSSKEDVDFQGERKVVIKSESPDACTEPGCRYGCICHLCKLSDSGEEKEPDFKPPCDKEYCRLGCICDSIDTNSADKHHCRKPGCMFECKCPPKQPKPDIPRERDHSKKRKGKGAKKKKRTPEKKESEGSGKEEEILLGDDNEWEPPSKRKRGTGNSRFANLPKRETTYRLAKNLDAVSRKAMEVYASSEMFTEQKGRRRKSDQGYDDGSFMPVEQERGRPMARQEDKSHPRLNELTGLLEISDEDSDDEVYPEDMVSCARIVPYNGPYKQRRDLSQLNKRKGGPSSSKRPPKTFIDLVDSDREDNPGDSKGRRDHPSTSSESRPQSVTEKMGLTNKIAMGKDEKASDNPKWKTQMVCLKAKKKSDDKSQDPEAEIKLLEIMSNCNWEIDRTNMLSKISHIISKESIGSGSKSQFIGWGAYLLEFLPKASKPAVIPPELKPKLPNEMFSIRIKVTKNKGKEDKPDKEAKEAVVVEDWDSESKSKEVTEEEKKRYNMKLQKKLIEKIKFAERLRNLIIAEEQKGVTPSKFSVSREGIEKALKKYKTQLWKAYTGTSNFTIQQLKQALQAAKSSARGPSTSDGRSKSVPPVTTATTGDPLSSATMARIQVNQGVTVLTSTSPSAGHNSFINLGNLHGSVSAAGSNIKTVGNLVIHSALPASGHAATNGQHRFIDNIENVKNFDTAHNVPVSQTSKCSINASNSFQMSNAGLATTVSSDVVFMPLDKSIYPSQLPPGAKIAYVQSGPRTDGSPVPFKIGQPAVGSGQVRMNPYILPSPSPKSGLPLAKPVLNPALTSLASNQPVHSQGFRGATASVVSCLSGPQLAPRPQESGKPVQTSGNGVLVNGTSHVRAGFPRLQCVTADTISNSSSSGGSTVGLLPLKNISNFGSEKVPGGTTGVLTATNGSAIAPSIYPIRFANNTSGKMQVVPQNDMIGLPKLAPLPLKVVPDGNQVFLIPMSSSMAPGSTTTPLATNSNVNLQAVSQVSVGQPMPKQGTNSPMFFAVSVHDGAGTGSNVHNSIKTINSTVERKDTDMVNKEPKQFIIEENDFQKFESDNISEKGIAQVKKLNTVSGKTKGLKGQINENCDNIHFDSDDNCDIDSLASSTRSLSSLSDIMKADINALEHKLDASAEKLEEDKTNKGGAKINKATGHDEVHDILETAQTAAVEIINSLGVSDELEKEMGDSAGAKIKRHVRKENVKRNESKPDSDCVVLDDTDDDCVVNDKKELNKNQDKENAAMENSDRNKSQSTSKLKRKRTSDMLDSIDCEHEISKMQDHLENEAQQKEESNGHALQVERETIRIEDSEESDVDVTSYESLESAAYVLPGSSWSGQQNKRKSQHKTIPDDDDFQIKKFRVEVSKDTGQLTDMFMPSKSLKSNREKFRRLELCNLFAKIERTVFKYNSKMQRYRGKVPKHMILQEALNLLAALKRREEELKECLDDGKQYKETLQADLKEQIDSFVKSGVPEPIIKNFLKSVGKSLYPVATKHKKKAPQTSSVAELIEITDSEDSDTALEYDALTPAKVQENWTKLVDAHLCSLDAGSASANTDPAGPGPNTLTINTVGKPPVVKIVSVRKHQSLLVTSPASSSVQKEAVNSHSGDIIETQQDMSDGGNPQERKTVKLVTETDTVVGSPVTSDQTASCAISSLYVVTPGQKSSSDDEDVMSSTGDALIDHENDLIQNELCI